MLNGNEGILYLSRRDVERACQEIDSVAVIRNVFYLHGTSKTILPDEAYLAWTNQQGESVRSLNMPGYVGGPLKVAGTKIINSNPCNPNRGIPRASGLTLLYDDTSTQILCLMEGAYVSSLRTASVTALAVELLKGIEISSVAVIGAGVLARAHIELLAKRLTELDEILVFDIKAERVEALQRDLASLAASRGFSIKRVNSAEEAVRPAQLIVPVTTTTVGYIRFDWLQPGAILVNTSLDDPEPEVVLKADKVIVDDWHLVKSDSRRLIGRMYRQGQVSGPNGATASHPNCRCIDAELGEIVTGQKQGREHASEVILVNPFGLAIEDLAIATEVYHAAKERGMGISLER